MDRFRERGRGAGQTAKGVTAREYSWVGVGKDGGEERLATNKSH